MPKRYTRRQTEARDQPVRATLSSIVAATVAGLGPLRARRRELEQAAADAAGAPGWKSAFGKEDVAVIAEVKRRSPSAGDIAPKLDPALLSAAYAAGGARVISVLTEGPHFGGSADDLREVRRAVRVPVLRKDFIVDPVQVLESRAMGASAILLIARALPGPRLTELSRLARELGLAILVEVHRPEELPSAIAVEPDAIGVNSRDLETFTVDVAGVEALLARIPAGIIAVAESGIRVRSDVELVAGWGADAVLVGTALAASEDPAASVRALTGVTRTGAGRS